jgi:RNA polymerase sigma factor (sigma-70 family)
MANQVDNQLLQQINDNIGIAIKVSRAFCDNSVEREDVIQEMMYQLWKSYPRFDGRSKFSTWMYRVCLNTAMTFNRKNHRNKNEPILDNHHEIADQNHSQKEDNIKLLFEAIGTLVPLNKAIVLLYLEDMSYEEIATITGLTKSNVSVRLVRIKKDLEKIIRGRSNLIEDDNTR